MLVDINLINVSFFIYSISLSYLPDVRCFLCFVIGRNDQCKGITEGFFFMPQNDGWKRSCVYLNEPKCSRSFIIHPRKGLYLCVLNCFCFFVHGVEKQYILGIQQIELNFAITQVLLLPITRAYLWTVLHFIALFVGF